MSDVQPNMDLLNAIFFDVPDDNDTGEEARRKAAMRQEQQRAKDAEALEVMRAASTGEWSAETWLELAGLGYARHVYTGGDDMRDYGHYELNDDGQRLFDSLPPVPAAPVVVQIAPEIAPALSTPVQAPVVNEAVTTIESVRPWRDRGTGEIRIYLNLKDGRSGCLYRTGNKWNKKGSVDGKATEEEWQEARSLAYDESECVWKHWQCSRSRR